MNDLQRVIEVLPHLGHNELLKIHVRVGFLLKNSLDSSSHKSSSKYTEPDVDSLMLIEVISDVIASRGFRIHASVLRKSAAFSYMQKKTKRLFQFLNQSNFNHSEMRLLIKIGVKLLASDLEEIGIPVGGVTLMRHIHRMPSVINHAFPGYAASGALYMLIRRNGSASKVGGGQ